FRWRANSRGVRRGEGRDYPPHEDTGNRAGSLRYSRELYCTRRDAAQRANEARMIEPDYPPAQKTFNELAAKGAPLRRLGETTETAGLAVFLASRLSSYVTGKTVFSDGGISVTANRPAVRREMKIAALRAPEE